MAPVTEMFRGTRLLKPYLLVFGVLLALGIRSGPLAAQTETPSPESGTESGTAKAATQDATGTPATGPVSPFKRFLTDVGSDYKNFFSKETAITYGVGLGAAGLLHLADDEIREALADPPQATAHAFEGGDVYGNVSSQIPLAIG
jgi:hypothetical protein